MGFIGVVIPSVNWLTRVSDLSQDVVVPKFVCGTTRVIKHRHLQYESVSLPDICFASLVARSVTSTG